MDMIRFFEAAHAALMGATSTTSARRTSIAGSAGSAKTRSACGPRDSTRSSGCSGIWRGPRTPPSISSWPGHRKFWTTTGFRRLTPGRHDIGTGMTSDEVTEFSARVDCAAVFAYWSAIVDTERSTSFARLMRQEGFTRFEEIIDEFRERFNDKWLRA